MTMNTHNFGKVAVLYGGISAEREVSLKSGAMVHAALVAQGVDAHLFDTGERDIFELKTQGFERAYIALHGRFGEDGTVQGALELMHIPYTGSGVMASSLAMDKVRTKQIWLQAGLQTPNYVVLARGETVDMDAIVAQLGMPLFVKPPLEGSSVGAGKVTRAEDLQVACELAWRYDTHALIEQCIEGRETTCAVLGSSKDARALPLVEIIAPDGNYDFEHKYLSNDTVYECPAKLSDELSARIQNMVVDAYRVLGCAGWGRAEVLVRASDNEPFLLEMNTSPGMTDHSLVPMAARAVGVSYAQLVMTILADARLHVLHTPARNQ